MQLMNDERTPNDLTMHNAICYWICSYLLVRLRLSDLLLSIAIQNFPCNHNFLDFRSTLAYGA